MTKSFSDKVESICVRIVSPVLSVLVPLWVFLVSNDFDHARKLFPNWHGAIDILDSHYQTLVLIAFCLLLLVSNIIVKRRYLTQFELKKKLLLLETQRDSMGDNVHFCLEGFVGSLMRKLGFAEEGRSRISFYTHEKGSDRFVFCVRRSFNPRYERKGRTVFEASLGSIGIAWERGWHFYSNIPESKSDAAEYHKENFGLSKEVCKKLTMNPLLIASKKILDNEGRPMGVLVVESDKRDAFEEADLKARLSEAAEACAPLLLALMEYLPSPEFAEESGL